MEIKPFKAYRYNAEVVGSTGNCIAPPYDVIDADKQESLYAQSEFNIVRVIQGKTLASDSEQSNQYTRAADYLNQWIESHALQQDQQDTIYAYAQDFCISGQAVTRLSFIALARIEAFEKGIVKPHEQILSKPMQDRLNLKRATAARFGLVFMLYKDEERVADTIVRKSLQTPALIEFTDEQQVKHRLYAIDSERDQAAIIKMMGPKTCIIADGHHRYTTGLKLSQENPKPSAQYQLTAFANTCQEGLVVLATHRLVNKLDSFSARTLLAGLETQFDVKTWTFADKQAKKRALESMLAEMQAQFQQNHSAVGIYAADNAFYVAVLKDRQAMDKAAPKMSPAWRHLDVAILHRLILEDALGIDEEKLAQGSYVSYVKDTPTAVADSITQVDKAEQQAAFFTNPVKIDQLVAVTDAGERMPQKSTYFYPKMYTGLTIQKL
jgi:uncharacterized protein (DUF1015 family)